MKYIKITENELFLVVVLTSIVTDLMFVSMLKMVGIN